MRRIEIGNNLRGRPKMPCGEGAPTLIIASVGTSSSGDPIAVEVEKCAAAARLGAHVVTDHWTVAVHPVGAEAALAHRNRLDDQLIQCSMCGDYCGINAGIATVKLGPTRLRDSGV
jgi:thiamine biosynthesis protein ThiC